MRHPAPPHKVADMWLKAPIARDLFYLTLAKVAILAVLFFLFFGPATRPVITPERVRDAIVGAASPTPHPASQQRTMTP